MNVVRNVVTAAIVVLLQGQPVVWTSFPGPSSELPSPSGDRMVINVDNDTEPNHVLKIRVLKTSQLETLMSYDRSVDVGWSSDGQALCVTDHGGSDYSRALMFRFDRQSVGRTDISDLIRHQFSDDRHLAANHHVYFACSKWLSSQTVEVSASGYGELDRDGFEERFVYSLDGHLNRSAR